MHPAWLLPRTVHRGLTFSSTHFTFRSHWEVGEALAWLRRYPLLADSLLIPTVRTSRVACDVFVEMPHRIRSELAEIVAASRHVVDAFKLVRVFRFPKDLLLVPCIPASVKLPLCLSCTVCFVHWISSVLMLDQFCQGHVDCMLTG